MTDLHPQIRHIVFDLGNVLVQLDRDTPYRRLAPHLRPDRAALARRDREGFDALIQKPAEALETGRIDFAEFHEWVSDILRISLTLDELHVIWCDMFRMDREMVALGTRLASAYDTVLASNTSRAHYEWIIEKFPQVAFFRAAALSYELGVMKPDREYYEKMIDRLNVDPGRSVFIDDLADNITAAVQSGFRGIVFTGRDPLLERLAGLGVEIPDE
jgi:glucose-1-phosphatase